MNPKHDRDVSDYDSAMAQGLDERLARFAGAITGLLLVFIAFTAVQSWVEGEPTRLFTTRAGLAQLGLALASGLAWRIARGANAATVRAVDHLFPLGLGLASVAILWGSPPDAAPDLVALLLVTLVLLARSAVVPSSTASTLGIGLLAFAPTLFATSRGFGAGSAEPIRIVFVMIWSVASVSVATMCSHVVYGLRSQVLTALKLGPYQLGRRLGHGGMGEVYEAHHERLRRPAAIKLLLPEIVSEAAMARFEQEVQLTATLQHPNTISIYDFGRTATGTFFYVMERVDGMSLHELVVEHGPLETHRLVFILRQAVEALAEAHDRGLVHRDIKPANIMVGMRAGLGDFVKVVDFGLAHPVLEAPSKSLVAGTPHFLAPETISGVARVDGRADLYAIGVTAYFVATGNYPFEGQNTAAICADHLRHEPAPPRDRGAPDLDPAFEAIILRCLAKAPEDRFENAQALAVALGAVEDHGAWNHEAASAWWSKHPRNASTPPSRESTQRARVVAPTTRRLRLKATGVA